MAAPMEAKTFRVIKTFVGHEPPLLLEKQGPVARMGESLVLISLHPSRKLRHDLARIGFTHIQEFSILPSRARLRWLLPAHAPLMLSGLQMYAPFSFRARLFKSLLSGMTRLGWKGWSRAKLVVASRKPLPLQVLVTEVTGEKHPVFALSVGNPEHLRLLTVQVMRPCGEVLGYIKLPLVAAAGECVQHEAKVLSYLWEKSPALHRHIPRVLHSGQWDNDFLLFQSGGPSKPGPQRFEKMHLEFLELLQQVDLVERTGNLVVEETATSWRRVESRLDLEWRRVGEDTLHQARQFLGETPLRCGVMHGDFAPWNTRQQKGQLFVFDWESARWQAPNMWDIFRFYERVSLLLDKKQVRYPEGLASTTEQGLFLLYCLRSVCDALEHGGCRVDAKLNYQKHQVLRCLRQGLGQNYTV